MKKSVLLCVILMVTPFISAQQINVPADQPSIQAAIDSASNGDTVIVEEDTYYENINFLGKAITVASRFILDGDTAHISRTIIDGSQPQDPDTASVVTMWSGEDTTSVLMGFTIRGGSGTWTDFLSFQGYPGFSGGGIYMLNAGGKILHNVIEENHIGSSMDTLCSLGGGILVFEMNGQNVLIRNNIIRNNSIPGYEASGGGIYLEGGNITIDHNTIEFNLLTSELLSRGGGIYSRLGDASSDRKTVKITNNMIRGNILTSETNWQFGGGMEIAGGTSNDDYYVANNLITGHHLDWGGGGIHINTQQSQVVMCNNSVIDNSADKLANSIIIETKNNKDVIVFNNIFWSGAENESDEIYLWYDNSPVVLMNNIITEELDSNYTGVIQGGNLHLDPLLDNITYIPGELSPAVGRGLDSLSIQDKYYVVPHTDLNRDPRPHPIDGRVDIGAIESPYMGYVYIPDTAFLNALIEDGADTNGDSLISYEEAEAVTNLNINGEFANLGYIVDMVGIEAFVNLYTLNCSFNQLTSLDVSINTTLEYLDCSGNQLTNLDVSINTALGELYCGGNQLTSLDVSNNAVLSNLYIDANQISSIDLSNNDSLYDLECYGNQLESLDLSNNHKLKIVFCTNNEIVNLNFAAENNLMFLDCQNNLLTHLNLTESSNLRFLDCSKNYLTELDLRNNKLIGSVNSYAEFKEIFGVGWAEFRYMQCDGLHTTICPYELGLGEMPTLNNVCVWNEFSLDSTMVYTTYGSPNVQFTTECTTSDVTQLYEYVSIYPNPTNTLLTIETEISGQYDIDITSLNGQLLYSGKMEGPTHQLDLSSFQKGVYFITVRSKDFVTTRKIVKL